MPFPNSTATLNSQDLPPQFSYTPYVITKRVTTVQTANAVIIQSSNPQYVAGTDTLGWSIELATGAEYKMLSDLFYTATPTAYTFVGYWGETLSVHFSQLDSPTVRGRYWDISGNFQVVCVTTFPQPTDCL